MIASVQNFTFEGALVRAVWRGEEPWFVGRDVCVCLGLKNSNDALSTLDGDEKGVATTDPLAPGGEQIAVVISEPGVYRLVFRSRKPEAQRFKRWLAHEVLPQLRKTGAFPGPADARAACGVGDPAAEPLLHRLQIVREARAIHGRAVAAILWRKLGLPAVPPPPPTPIDEARQLLRQILDAPDIPDGVQLRELLARAFDDDEEARLRLIASGIRVYADRETFVLANAHPWLSRALAGTEWAAHGACARVLRRLPEARPSGPTRMGPLQPRGTELPATVLDD